MSHDGHPELHPDLLDPSATCTYREFGRRWKLKPSKAGPLYYGIGLVVPRQKAESSEGAYLNRDHHMREHARRYMDHITVWRDEDRKLVVVGNSYDVDEEQLEVDRREFPFLEFLVVDDNFYGYGTSTVVVRGRKP